jgi:hypothetical protein
MATERFNARPQSGTRRQALGMRRVFGVVRPRAEEAKRAGEKDKSPQSDSAERLLWLPADSKLRWELETAGIAPASLIPHVDTRRNRWFEAAPFCLQTACVDSALRERVAK